MLQTMGRVAIAEELERIEVSSSFDRSAGLLRLLRSFLQTRKPRPPALRPARRHLPSAAAVDERIGLVSLVCKLVADGQMLAVGISNSHEIDIVNARSGAIALLRLPGLENSDIWNPVWSADGWCIYLSAWGAKNGTFRASTGPIPEVEQVMEGRAREIRMDGDRALYSSRTTARASTGSICRAATTSRSRSAVEQRSSCPCLDCC